MPKCTVVDPPGGWRYGFPKKLTQREGQSYGEWLAEQGYPQWLIANAERHSRYWLAEDEEGEAKDT